MGVSEADIPEKGIPALLGKVPCGDVIDCTRRVEGSRTYTSPQPEVVARRMHHPACLERPSRPSRLSPVTLSAVAIRTNRTFSE